MNPPRKLFPPALTVLAGLTVAVAMPEPARAQDGDDWTFAASMYAWVPTMGGEASIPLHDAQDVSFELDPGDVLSALEMTFQGAAEVQKGHWGAFTDLIYLDLGGTDKEKRSFELGDIQIPADAQLKVDANLSGWIWTTALTYRVVEDAARPMQVIGGVRMLDLTQEVKLDFQGDITGLPLPGRTARGEVENTWWDAIVGIKGRFDVGQENAWFVPYYGDIGTGDSDFTWQAMLGVGYVFGSFDVLAVWRYLGYDMPQDDHLRRMYSSGAAIGATFRF